MKYFEILSLICDSDTQATVDFSNLFFDMNIDFLISEEELTEHPVLKNFSAGEFLALSKENEHIILNYFYDGKNSVKSCNRRVQLDFCKDLNRKIAFNLEQDELTDNTLVDRKYRQLLMRAIVYDRVRDNVDPNQVYEQKSHTIYFYLRKWKKYMLETKISYDIKNNSQKITNLDYSLFNNIDKKYQEQLEYICERGVEF